MNELKLWEEYLELWNLDQRSDFFVNDDGQEVAVVCGRGSRERVLFQRYHPLRNRAMTADARKRAQARYDKKRPKGILVRLSRSELATLDALRIPGESRPAAIKRLVLGGDNEA